VTNGEIVPEQAAANLDKIAGVQSGQGQERLRLENQPRWEYCSQNVAEITESNVEMKKSHATDIIQAFRL
jgi:hypothetical protein